MKNIHLSLMTMAIMGVVACGSSGGGSSGSQASDTSQVINNSTMPSDQTASKNKTTQESQPKEEKTTSDSTTVPSSSNSTSNVSTSESPNTSNKNLSKDLASRFQKEKFIDTPYTLWKSSDEIPTSNTEFIVLNQDFGREHIPLELFPRYKLVQEETLEHYTYEGQSYESHGFLRVYNQLYSGVSGFAEYEEHIIGEEKNENSPENNYEILNISGINTKQLPTSGIFRYTGVAFDMKDEGMLDYSVDFSTKLGSGSISGLTDYGKITLSEGKIDNIRDTVYENDPAYIDGYRFSGSELGIKANARSEKNVDDDVVSSYSLLFFGPNAEEITGFVESDLHQTPNSSYPEEELKDSFIGFGGTKQ
ncbi:factor H binding protein domain-containing protein [Otariodibacter oris]|uniref:Factor H binding protein-like C-terminal domain-containing protein n=1 Tax=Otariodibacter oris TaxID=1032623 RepID=A0A420XEB2_9PAST|nr:factor H binding protein domain-containing protein [Otariodibacter oris]QGM80134.1 hypothetical protein A6A10_01275 [Otariodibacter oris]RKR70478.1 hypothetical protein DES31_1922 [Otariodibacter oris]